MLKDLILQYIEHGDFTLHSGKKSDTYYNIKKLCMDYPNVVADELCYHFETLEKVYNVTAVGGPATGGALLALIIKMRKPYLKSFFTKDGKLFGTLDKDDNIIIIDDVYTTGDSINECRKIIKDYNVVIDLVIVNRNYPYSIYGVHSIINI